MLGSLIKRYDWAEKYCFLVRATFFRFICFQNWESVNVLLSNPLSTSDILTEEVSTVW